MPTEVEETTVAADAIKTMKLYTHLDRIQAELRVAGLGETLTAETLSEYDSMHYLGNEAIRNAIQATNILSETHVLDIGSGLGGPARMMSHYTNCRVDALELQDDLHALATTLTRQCRLQDRVQHYCGNILEWKVSKQYDVVVSWLVFLHISERMKLFEQCAKALVTEGMMYVEDFVKSDNGFTDREQQLLAQEVYVQHTLPTWDQLRIDLLAAGFEIVSMQDMTDSWRNYVSQREEAYAAQINRHERVHGKQGAKGLQVFYQAMKELFRGGTLCGVAYTVRKKA